MSALSDQIDAVTATLDTIATQFPPAVAAAIAAGGGGVDQAALDSANALTTASGALVTALQGALPNGNVTL